MTHESIPHTQGFKLWHEQITSRITDKVKLVGPTISCEGSPKVRQQFCRELGTHSDILCSLQNAACPALWVFDGGLRQSLPAAVD